MKEIKNKEFSEEIKVYSGIKDSFGNTCLLLVNEDLCELRIVSKNKDYNKKRRFLDSVGCNKVYVSRYEEVINISKTTKDTIEKEFPGYKHTKWETQ